MRRTLVVRVAAIAAALTGALAIFAGPAGAIESPEFRLEPADRDGPRANFQEALRPGKTTKDELVVTNKTKRPLALRLSVAPATVGKDGSVRLTGNKSVASWVKLDAVEVTLAPRASRTVGFEVRAPRELPKTAMTMAIVAEPSGADGGAAVAVLQRLAVMAYMGPAKGSSLVATLGWILWAAGAALIVVIAVALSPTRRGKRRVARLSALRPSRGRPARAAAMAARAAAAASAKPAVARSQVTVVRHAAGGAHSHHPSAVR